MYSNQARYIDPLLNNVYAYFDWDEQGGRLDWFKTYTSTVNNLLQHLAYDYDNLGNIENLYDYMSGNPQTQTFTYDSLNRLTSAQATGGTIGNYAQQSYTYDASTGNLASKAGVSYGYNDAAHTHAVTHLGDVQKYWYDANGNQTKRIIGADTYDLYYDAENRLVEVKKNNSVYATFVYNADGQRVKSTVNGVSIGYVGSYAEWSSSALTSYYYAGAAQIAMRQSGELIYVFGDHLGSTSKTYKASNGETKMQLYTPWGERRYPTAASEISTRYRYTGQYEYSELGLYFYQSRWYDASLGRFAQADTIVPLATQGVQALDRYAYVNNSPVNFVDPTGRDLEQIIYNKREELPRITEKPIIDDPSSIESNYYEVDISNTCVYWYECPSYASFSFGLDIPTIIIIIGAGIAIVDPKIGVPIALNGAVFELAGTTGIPQAVLVKATSLGLAINVDAYGHLYIGPQISVGKSAIPFSAIGLTTGHIMTNNGLFANANETKNFIQSNGLPSIAINTGLGIGATAVSHLPSGVTFSPQAENKFAKTGTVIQSTLASFDTTWSFHIADLWTNSSIWMK